MKTLSATGPIRFAGSLNESSTVTINGQPATVAADNSFQADVTLPPGNNTVAIVAKDASNNTTTKSYTVPVASGTARTLTYDLNGNMLNNGAGQTYEWDAADRLVKITQTSGITEFVYDGAGRRVKEKLNGAEIKRWVWCGEPQPCEERDGSNIVTKRFYAGLGEQIGVITYFYTTDHLGSVREMTDSSGIIHARYDYDPYGRITKVSGNMESDFGFTGFYRHQASGLSLTLFRAYDVDLGRWLSRDPIEEEGGINLYGYVSNNPISFIDPLGLAYTAARPLQNSFGGVVSPFIGKGYAGKHHQIFFEDGKLPSNLGLFDDDSIRPDDAPIKLQVKYRKINQGFDDATMRQAIENVKVAHGTDWRAKDNCQDFVQRAVDEYFRLKREELMKLQKLKDEQKKLKPVA